MAFFPFEKLPTPADKTEQPHLENNFPRTFFTRQCCLLFSTAVFVHPARHGRGLGDSLSEKEKLSFRADAYVLGNIWATDFRF